MNELNALMTKIKQDHESGGMHTPPELRLFLCSLILMQRAKQIVETGYDAGYTTFALSMTGAKVLAVDNLAEYADAEFVAQELLKDASNVRTFQVDALAFLSSLNDESVDFAFIDDNHEHTHVDKEAIELRRVLSENGLAVFHDVRVPALGLWNVLCRVFPDWERISLPAMSPEGTSASGMDMGIGMVRKPVNGRKRGYEK